MISSFDKLTKQQGRSWMKKCNSGQNLHLLRAKETAWSRERQLLSTRNRRLKKGTTEFTTVTHYFAWHAACKAISFFATTQLHKIYFMTTISTNSHSNTWKFTSTLIIAFFNSTDLYPHPTCMCGFLDKIDLSIETQKMFSSEKAPERLNVSKLKNLYCVCAP